MKTFLKDAAVGILMGLVLPGMMLNFAALLLKQTGGEKVSPVAFSSEPTQTQEVPEEAKVLPMQYLKPDGTEHQTQMDAYLVGVVLAEMPAWFSQEALKAQAVVARTYALKAGITGGKHGNGSVCTQPGCCQAYISEADYLAKGGTSQDVEKVRSAVAETSDMVLVYNGELIEATYFSCSGGSTEDAVAVWGTNYPYLQAVASPGEEKAQHYTDTEYMDGKIFCSKLGIQPDGEPKDWLGEMTYTAGGGIDRAVIGGCSFSGVQLRSLLGLRSTAISMTPEQSGITIQTKGYGHRVGMSQYGADAMAAAGSVWQEILAYYYKGTSLINWKTRTVTEENPHDA